MLFFVWVSYSLFFVWVSYSLFYVFVVNSVYLIKLLYINIRFYFQYIAKIRQKGGCNNFSFFTR